MTNRKESPISSELRDLGFHQSKAKRGLVTYMFAILGTLLFISMTANVAQYRIGLAKTDARIQEYQDCRNKLDEVLIQLLVKQNNQENKVDTAKKLLERIKNLEP